MGSAGFLAATGLSKSFDGAPVVDDVSFSIGRQEVFGLLGPNGAGKTTTIRMLSTVLAPDAGDGTIGGHSVLREADEVRKIIGVLPPGACPLRGVVGPGQSGLLRADGGTRSQAGEGGRCREPGVGRIGRPQPSDAVRKFSGGMKRRVNIAVALMSSPSSSSWTSPPVGVDPQSRNHIFETILRLRTRA